MADAAFAETPEPPYYAVIFTSRRTEGDRGYDKVSQEMVALVGKQPGFLGVESVRGTDGVGITVSYFTNEESIAAWKANLDHLRAQAAGKAVWYAQYSVRVARVERDYGL